MAQIFVKTRDGEIRAVPAVPGTSVMELIRDAGIDDLAALCGGSCSCATCHIYVDSPAHTASLPAASEAEDDLLDGSDHRVDGSRLGCQLIYCDSMDGMKVTIAPEG